MDKKLKEVCLDVDTECVLSHICYRYAAMVMSGLVEALEYFGGKQGTKVLRRILAKRIPMEMMEAMEVDPSLLKKFTKEDISKLLPEMIKSKGGPDLSIDMLSDGQIKFTLNECHFLPYSKSKGFCNITAGLMLGFAQMLSGKPMDIEEIQTIAKGGENCVFIAKPKF
ncbi:methanogen output domain 1-containing protein [Hippea maritima]|uniref:4-vinyl reductase 4VR n=1 Tax=Hippea maritima (strain ATCC 700847 / DSM 10411 / MH2) TaxID=760142 RepID=F2LY51_HIPMA|nr:methanogen output domain 1-containing protein [Hippea maritima]AEA34374.1 4-vinyl reductase 4VR [Hippea maritima DSM 10411]